MILCWLEILASFEFTVRHRKGTLHGNADSLSRAPHAALPTPLEEKILVSDEGAVMSRPYKHPRALLWKRCETISRGTTIFKMCNGGRPSPQRGQKNSSCVRINVSYWPSYLHFSKMPLLGCGV